VEAPAPAKHSIFDGGRCKAEACAWGEVDPRHPVDRWTHLTQGSKSRLASRKVEPVNEVGIGADRIRCCRTVPRQSEVRRECRTDLPGVLDVGLRRRPAQMRAWHADRLP